MAEAVLKTILRNDKLQKYIYETSAFPREHELLKEIREATFNKYGADKGRQIVPVDEGLFLSMLLKIMKPSKTLEIGVFTCYSLLTTALAIPDHGKIIAIDLDQEAYEVGLPFIQKAGVEHKIKFIHSDATSALKDMVNKEKVDMEFDFVFVDGDKPNYTHYHEYLMKLVKIGGVIAYDNTLWHGTIVLQENEVPEYFKPSRAAVIDFNLKLASDPRIDISQVSIGDGVTLCRRLQ